MAYSNHRGGKLRPKWLIIAGDLRFGGGMDRANFELALYLARTRVVDVHLVAHNVDARLLQYANVRWHRAPRPLGRHALGEIFLRRTAAWVVNRWAPFDQIVANGGNSPLGTLNWVHAVHAAWHPRHENAPLSFRTRARWQRTRHLRHEQVALRSASTIVANSYATRDELIKHYGIEAGRINVVYLGVDASLFAPADYPERVAARHSLRLPVAAKVFLFVGALGYDRNKGIDVLMRAWSKLLESVADAKDQLRLLVVGAGQEHRHWQDVAKRSNFKDTVQVLGMRSDIPQLLHASDGLIAPSFYESYGLSVHEAICAGVPAIVSGRSGVAERFPPELQTMILSDPGSSEELRRSIERLVNENDTLRDQVRPFGAALRHYTWADMARDFVRLGGLVV